MNNLKKYLLAPLILAGALNWGSIGLFRYDFLAAIFMQNEMALRIVDILIGLAAVVAIVIMFTDGKKEK